MVEWVGFVLVTTFNIQELHPLFVCNKGMYIVLQMVIKTILTIRLTIQASKQKSKWFSR